MRLGGDSIRAIRLVAAAREAGFGLTVGDIFSSQHLQDLATRMTTMVKHPSSRVSEKRLYTLLERTTSLANTKAPKVV